jgi:hypothetical protein
VPDVSAYLSVPQWIWGGVLPQQIGFFPGYGLLLSPLGWLPGSTLHTSALMLNGVCAAACVIILGRFARNLGLPNKYVPGVWLLASLHPSMALASRIAWPEFVLVLIVSAIAVLIQGHQVQRWRIAASLSCISLTIHPRSIVIVLAFIIVAFLAKQLKAALVGFIPTLVIPIAALTVTGSWPGSRISAAADDTSWLGTLAVGFGQIGALGAGTCGLAIVGAVIGVKQLKTPITGVLKDPAAAFLAIGAAGMVILGGIVLTGGNQADVFLYGRYIDLWAVPLSVLGICCIHRRALTLKTALASLFISLSGLLVAMLCSSAVEGPPRRIMSLSLGSVWQLFDGRLLPTTLVGASLVLLLGFGISKNTYCRLTPVLLSLLLLSGSSTYLDHLHLANVGRIADGQVTTTGLLPENTVCLAYDSTSAKSYALWLYRLELPGIKHKRIRLSESERPCGSYVIAGTKALADCRGATLLGSEPRADWGLWEYPETGCG